MVEVRKQGEYWNLQMEEGEFIIVSFNYPQPLSRESTGKDGSPYTWWLFNINFEDEKEGFITAGFFVYNQEQADNITNVIDSFVDVRDNIKDYKWILSRPRVKNNRTGRYYTDWQLTPYTEDKQKEIKEGIELNALDEFLDNPEEFELGKGSVHDMTLSAREIELLNREKLFTAGYGMDVIKNYLFNAGIPEERADALSDELVDGTTGNIIESLVRKYGRLDNTEKKDAQHRKELQDVDGEV